MEKTVITNDILHKIFHDDNKYKRNKTAILNESPEYEENENGTLKLIKPGRIINDVDMRALICNLVFDKETTSLHQPYFYDLREPHRRMIFIDILNAIKAYEPEWAMSYGYTEAKKFINDYDIQPIFLGWLPAKIDEDDEHKIADVVKISYNNKTHDLIINEYTNISDLKLNAGILADYADERKPMHKYIKQILQLAELAICGFRPFEAKMTTSIHAYRMQNPNKKSYILLHVSGTKANGKSTTAPLQHECTQGKVKFNKYYPAPTLDDIRFNLEEIDNHEMVYVYEKEHAKPTSDFAINIDLSALTENFDGWNNRRRSIYVDDEDKNITKQINISKLKSVITQNGRSPRMMHKDHIGTEDCIANVTMVSNDKDPFNIDPEDGMVRRLYPVGNFLTKEETRDLVNEWAIKLFPNPGDPNFDEAEYDGTPNYRPTQEVNGKIENFWGNDLQLLRYYLDVVAQYYLDYTISDDFFKLKNSTCGDEFNTYIKNEILSIKQEESDESYEAQRVKSLLAMGEALHGEGVYSHIANDDYIELNTTIKVLNFKGKTDKVKEYIESLGYKVVYKNNAGFKKATPHCLLKKRFQPFGKTSENPTLSFGKKSIWYLKTDKTDNIELLFEQKFTEKEKHITTLYGTLYDE